MLNMQNVLIVAQVMAVSILRMLNCWQAYLRSFLYCFSICVFMHLFDKICNYTSQIAHMLCTFETLFFSMLALLLIERYHVSTSLVIPQVMQAQSFH